MPGWTWPLVVAVLAIGAFALARFPALRSKRRHAELARAKKGFHLQRERLEARFVQLAGASGKPRGLRWVNCEFDDDVTYARERLSGQLRALVGVTISFEAIEGGGMEEVEAVGNLRAATAVFSADKDCWTTEGRALFNLNPDEAIDYFGADLVRIGPETMVART